MSLGAFAGDLPRDSLQEEQGSELVLLCVDASPESSLVMVGTVQRVECEGCRQGAGMVVRSCPPIWKAGPAWEGVLQPSCSLLLLMQR